jgi:hypothetical protein
MCHDSDIYISSLISGLGGNGRFRGLDKIWAGERFWGFGAFVASRELAKGASSRHGVTG